MRTKILLISVFSLFGAAVANAAGPAQQQTCQNGQPCQTVPAQQQHQQKRTQAHQQKRQGPQSTQTQHQVKAQQRHQTAGKTAAHHQPGMYVVTANKLNMRAKPGAHGISGRLHHGDTVKVIEFSNGWAKVLIQGHYHWISSQYIRAHQ